VSDDDTRGEVATEPGPPGGLRFALAMIAAVLLGMVLALLLLQFPEVTGWTIERATDTDLPPI